MKFIEMTGKTLATIIDADELYHEELHEAGVDDDTVVRINQQGDIEVRRKDRWDVVGGLLGEYEKRLQEAQFTHGKEENFTDAEWDYYLRNMKEMFKMINISVYKKNGSEFINVDGKMLELAPVNFRKIIPKGGLKGYESH